MSAMITVLFFLTAGVLVVSLLTLGAADRVRRESEVLRRDFATLETSYASLLSDHYPERLAAPRLRSPYVREVRHAVA